MIETLFQAFLLFCAIVIIGAAAAFYVLNRSRSGVRRIEPHEDLQRRFDVADARRRKICRICGQKAWEPMTDVQGHEYAHTVCVRRESGE
jgi:hypothetical protein